MPDIRWASQPSFELIENEDKSLDLKCYGEAELFEGYRIFKQTVTVIEDSYENYKFPMLFNMVHSAFEAWINQKESEIK